jgi:hypothetical protein
MELDQTGALSPRMVRHVREGATYSFDVMKANEKNDHDAAGIVCEECKSLLVTLHAPSASRTGVRTKKAVKASEMAAQEIDRLIDPSAPDEERQRRKRRLLKGPKEFRDVRGGNRPKLK